MHASIERFQVWVYLGSVALGLSLAVVIPAVAEALGSFVWPLLAALLFATFSQTPLARLPETFRDRRFLLGLLLGNFLILPLLVGVALNFLPLEPAVRLGILLVLLVPCTDWFISFAHLGRGDARRAVASTPLSLLLQIPALPFYLWLFLGATVADMTVAVPLLLALSGLVILPLALAFLLQRQAARRPELERTRQRMALLPVPLLGLVVFVIAASQAPAVFGLAGGLWLPALIFAAFALAAALLGKCLGQMLDLSVPAARTLSFSFATRNSFVVLPLALALPQGWEAAALVIVLQSLVELLAMSLLVQWVPDRLIPEAGSPR